MKALSGNNEFEGALSHAVFFPGCTLNRLAPELCKAVEVWLERESVTTERFDGCCGLPLLLQGDEERYGKASRGVVRYLEKKGADAVIAACPNCFYSLCRQCQEFGSQVKVVALPRLMVQKGCAIDPEAMGEGIFTIHDSCPDREGHVFARAVRDLARELNVVEMAHHGASAICCGVGAEFADAAFDEQVAQAAWRLEEAQAIEADAVIAACANCVFALTQADSGIEIYHYLELVFGELIDWYAKGEQYGC